MKSSVRETCAKISGLVTNEQLVYRNVNIDDKVSINKQTYPVVAHKYYLL